MILWGESLGYVSVVLIIIINELLKWLNDLFVIDMGIIWIYIWLFIVENLLL